MTKSEAIKYANQTAKRLKEKLGGDWQTDVGYNLWWYAGVSLGSISVSIHENFEKPGQQGKFKIMYTTLINSTIGVSSGGLSMWTGDNDHKLPEESVKKAMKDAQEVVTQLQNTLLDNYSKMPEVNAKIQKRFEKVKRYEV